MSRCPRIGVACISGWRCLSRFHRSTAPRPTGARRPAAAGQTSISTVSGLISTRLTRLITSGRILLGRSIGQLFRDPTGALDELLGFDAAGGLLTDRIEEFAMVGEQGAQSVDDQSFEIAGRDAPAASARLARPGHERGRHVVSVSRALLDGMGWRQSLTGLHRTGDRSGGSAACARAPLARSTRFSASVAWTWSHRA